MWQRNQAKRSVSRIALALILVVLASGVAYVFRGSGGAGKPPPPEFALPRLSESRFLNTSPEATYVGTGACAGCHADESRSYRATAHSRALAEVSPPAEPPDAEFFQPLSGRSYEVYRDGGRLRHRETIVDDQGNALTTVDFSVRYLIGSGRHTRSYLVEEAGFLMESPLTWYAARQKWAMSPGFDRPNHWSFERAADVGCLTCHVGAVESPARVYQKVAIRERAIGCERCHGPGSLHVDEKWSRRHMPQVPTDNSARRLHASPHRGKLRRRVVRHAGRDRGARSVRGSLAPSRDRS